MNDPFFLIPGAINLVILIVIIYFISKAFKVIKKFSKLADILLEKYDK